MDRCWRHDKSGVAAFPDKGSFIAKAPDVASPMAIRSLDDMVALVATPPSERPEQIIDARSSGRFSGKSPEPCPGMASGHMPGALSCPISHLIDADTGQCKSPAQIMSIFSEAGIDLDKPVVTSCGSGVTAWSCLWFYIDRQTGRVYLWAVHGLNGVTWV